MLKISVSAAGSPYETVGSLFGAEAINLSTTLQRRVTHGWLMVLESAATNFTTGIAYQEM